MDVFSLWTAVTLVKSPLDALTYIFEKSDLEHSISQSSPAEVSYLPYFVMIRSACGHELLAMEWCRCLYLGQRSLDAIC